MTITTVTEFSKWYLYRFIYDDNSGQSLLIKAPKETVEHLVNRYKLSDESYCIEGFLNFLDKKGIEYSTEQHEIVF